VYLHGLAAFWRAKRAAAPWARGGAATDAWFAAEAGGAAAPRDLAAAAAGEAGPFGRCAVVGSGHALRCGTWGPTLDAFYDAVIRVNHVQLEPDVRRNFACVVGTRADFVVNPLRRTADADIKLRGGRAVVKSPRGYADYVAAHPRGAEPPLLPARAVLERGLGSGSGSTALALALSLCAHVDAFGFGVYRGAAAGDFRYLHFYQSTPADADSTAGGAQVLNSELRNLLFDAFGLANFVWY